MAEVVVAPEGRGGTPTSFGHAGLALADRAARPGAHVVRKRQMATEVVAHAHGVFWSNRSRAAGTAVGVLDQRASGDAGAGSRVPRPC